jgi:FtsZ-binding cell division protein ZapB
VPKEEHVAPERRHISRQHLKDWIAAQFPSDKPKFLFDEIERNTHTAINKDAYQALQAERDGLRARLEKAADEYRKLRSERDELVVEKAKLTEQIKPAKELGLRAETTYLNIIGGMLNLFLMKSPAGKAHSVFSNQASVIEALVINFGNQPGISKRGLETKFADAKKSLDP